MTKDARNLNLVPRPVDPQAPTWRPFQDPDLLFSESSVKMQWFFKTFPQSRSPRSVDRFIMKVITGSAAPKSVTGTKWHVTFGALLLMETLASGEGQLWL